LTSDLNTRIQATAPNDDDPAAGQDAAEATVMRQQLVDWAKGKVASWGAARSSGEAPAAGAAFAGEAAGLRAPLELRPLQDFSPLPLAGEGPGARAEETSLNVPSPASPRSPSALQIHNRYLVTETEEGVTIIDQHALHERILYEQLRQRIAAGAIETQTLLVPEPVDLGPAERAAALEHRDLLAELGVKIEPFGGQTLLVAAYPAMLANINPVEILRALLERILTDVKQPDRRDLLDDLLHTIACKAAIKAGDRLAPGEIIALLEQRHLCDDAHHCPHGRPTALVFTREELDKQFKRV
jgi:DNA mismatch repair protein MutL